MARFQYWNENPRKLTTNDCVTRAITFATDMPYEEVSKKLWLTADLYNCDRLCKFCYSNFITNVLKYKEVNCDRYSVGEFADTHPYGVYLIRIEGHLTTIKDGVVYDIWDCRNELCDTVWKRVD